MPRNINQAEGTNRKAASLASSGKSEWKSELSFVQGFGAHSPSGWNIYGVLQGEGPNNS